ncbi:ABC transporter F family member 4-like [Nilaparvata lugens]|uniref:ABC transporter F family member 4-like n=1 Tax=Nilaparvata lugens TaxID=108931 RepID=UPI00193D243A|nr:ABC transporter F family member 4-like [Nilaparvata lugens]XP_039275318.1 ABC transporter F family member 4-like [Nilaparvata lugens]
MMNENRGSRTERSKVETRCCNNPCYLCQQLKLKLWGQDPNKEAPKKEEAKPPPVKPKKSKPRKKKKKKVHNMDEATAQENMSALFRMMRDYYALKLASQYTSTENMVGDGKAEDGERTGATVPETPEPTGDENNAAQPMMNEGGEEEEEDEERDEDGNPVKKHGENLYDENVIIPGSTGSFSKDDFPPPLPNDSNKKTTYATSYDEEEDEEFEDDDEDETWKKWQEKKT